MAAGLTLLKAVPFPFLLIALASRQSRWPAMLTFTFGVAVSFVLAPEAWLDWVRAWPHIAAMTLGSPPWNLSPAAAAAQFGLEEAGRAMGVALAVEFAICGIGLARWGRWPAAVAAAAASSLFVSPTLWDHYIVAIVPIVVAASWVAAPVERTVLVAGWAAMLTMWFGQGVAGNGLLWLAALLSVSIAAIRALGRVAPDPCARQTRLPDRQRTGGLIELTEGRPSLSSRSRVLGRTAAGGSSETTT